MVAVLLALAAGFFSVGESEVRFGAFDTAGSFPWAPFGSGRGAPVEEGGGGVGGAGPFWRGRGVGFGGEGVVVAVSEVQGLAERDAGFLFWGLRGGWGGGRPAALGGPGHDFDGLGWVGGVVLELFAVIS